MKIRWAKDPLNECGQSWMNAEEARFGGGPHSCIKDTGHGADPTNDDHQCCCGATTEED